jgi:hypothetical protein
MTEGEPRMTAKVQASAWLTVGWIIAQSGMPSDPIDERAPPLRCARANKFENVRFWSGVTRSMKSDARVSKRKWMPFFFFKRGRTDRHPFNDQYRLFGCINFRHAILRPFVCDIRDRIM